jgi:hypothetical protein
MAALGLIRIERASALLRMWRGQERAELTSRGLAVLAAIGASIWLTGCAPQRKAQSPSVPKPQTSPARPSSVSSSDAPSPASSPKEEAGERQDEAPAKPTAGASTGGKEGGGEGKDAQTAGGAQTPDEQRDTLDRHLDASLARFDALLLKEQQEVATKRAEQAVSGGTTSEGGEGEGDKGAGAGASAPGGAGQKAGAQAENQSGGQNRSSGGTRDRSTGSQAGSREENGREVATDPEGAPTGSGNPSVVPVDVGDGKDDDVVARQLREAAMKEQDPAIREKLWDEYRKYKRGS